MAGPPVRERYNAKARGSTAGGSHKKRKQKKPKAPVVVDEDGVPIPTGKRDEVMQEQSEDEGVYEGEGKGKMSSKKRKRLDSYINKKLKTEERLKTLKLLASLTPSASTSAALASTATLGQNPFMPSSAAERMDKKEDRLVRKGIHRLGKTADAESSDGSGDEVYEGRGKGRAVDVAIEIDREDAPAPMAQVTTDKGKKRSKLSKKASWNPNLLSTQPDSDSSSDFDSSASENDQSDIVEAGPSSPRACPPPRKLPIASARPLPSPAIAIAGSARDSQEVNIKGPAPAVKNAFAGALKKSADGQVVQPRVIQRRQKMPLGRLRTQPDDESDEENSVEDEEDSDDEDDDENGEDDDGESESDSGAEDSSEDGNEDEDQEEESQPKKKRSLGFKNWALQQMGRPGDPNNEDQTRSISPPPPPTDNKPKIPSARAPKTGEFVGPLGSKFEIPSTSLLTGNLPTKASSSSNAIPTVRRRPSIAESRMDLPILAEEQNIVEAIRMHPVVIIAGETGSGKTTQVPQMLYEAGFGYKTSDDPGMIAVTQPRRVAAVSLATRVKSELGFGPASSVVAHQIRYSSSTSPETCIKFMTDGVLLRELASDFLLSRYSVIIVDEAHERGVNTDVLIGVLSRVAKLRESKWRESQDKPAGDTDTKGSSTIRPLRIVIMSATLRIEDFAQNRSLFPTPPPVIHIPARQHPVTLHFSRKTTSDYVTEAYKKVCKIHARLPVGGILVFLTGQAEIQQLCRKLESKYGNKKGAGDGKQYTKKGKASLPIVQSVASTGDQVEAEDVDLGNDEDLAADVDDGDAVSDPEALDSDDDGDDDLDIDEASDAPMQILPLYSLLSNEQQMQVFDSPPEGHRMVIVATNVAETSLTIPGVRYVVDSGRSKERHYDSSSGVQTFQVSWISKASASQRAGRAGRTGPGHCYRLYSSALFEDHFAKFAQPEIMRMPIEGVVLQMKSMNIDQVVNFPFPTPPDRQQLSIAERLLTNLGALEKAAITRMVGGAQIVGSEGGRITDLGKAMAGYPVTPRFAKMLVIGNQHECLAYVIAIVACLSVGDPFLHELSIDEGNDSADDEENETVGASRKAELLGIRSEELRKKEERKDLRKRYFNAHAQFMGLGNGTSDMFKMLAAVGAYEHEPTFDFCTRHFLRPKAMQEIQQLRHQIANIMKMPSSKLTPPTDNQMKVLRQVMTASSLDRIAVRQDVFLKKTTTFSSTRGVPYRAIGLGKEEIFIHPSSSLFHKAPPEFLTYHETTRNVNSGKTWMKCITKINPSWLSTLGKGMCTYSKPAEVPKISSSKSKSKVEEVRQGEREVVVVPHFADLGVDLPPVRMKQKRIGTRWVLSE